MNVRQMVLGLSVLAVGTALAQSPATTKVDGIAFPLEYRAGDTALRLHGAGVFRAYVMLRVYAAALYLAQPKDAGRVLDDVPKRLEIYYFHNTPKNVMVETAEKTIAGNLTPAAAETVKERIDWLHRLYRDPKKGERFALTYVPGVGTELAFNGVAQGLIPGADFAAAYFGVWLGAIPSSEEMKQKLLRLP
jgi:hypothetical protein